MGGIYSCKCLKETIQENSYVCFPDPSKINRKHQQEIKEKNMLEKDDKIINVKNLNSTIPNTVNSTKSSYNSKRKNKEKNRSDLLKMPLEIINESGQEEILSPCISKQCFHHFDFNSTNKFKIDIHKVETQQPVQKSEENKNNNTLKNKSLSEKNTLSINSQTKIKGKGSIINSKFESIGSWRKLSINTIVSSKKLNSNRSDEYLLQGEIYKYLTDGTKLKSNYSQKFFVIKKNEMSYFKSKESFLSLHPPLGKIAIYLISKVDRIPSNSTEFSLNKQYYHFSIELIQEADRKNSLENVEGLSNIHKNTSNSNHISKNFSNPNLLTDSNDKSLNLPSLLNEINCKKDQEETNLKKGNKISLIKKETNGKNYTKLNKTNQNLHKDYDTTSFLDEDIILKLNTPYNNNQKYIFAEKNQDKVNKIVYLLNYLIDLENI